MAKFVVQMVDAYTKEVLNTEDEVFNNEADAEEYACECGGNYTVGVDVLSMSGRDYIPREDVEFVVEEVDED